MRAYFDHNATTPPDPLVIEAVARALSEDFGNASSVHHFGQRAKALLDDARSAVAELIGAEPAEVVFTSGGTEADNFALRGAAEAAGTTCRSIRSTAGPVIPPSASWAVRAGRSIRSILSTAWKAAGS